MPVCKIEASFITILNHTGNTRFLSFIIKIRVSHTFVGENAVTHFGCPEQCGKVSAVALEFSNVTIELTEQIWAVAHKAPCIRFPITPPYQTEYSRLKRDITAPKTSPVMCKYPKGIQTLIQPYRFQETFFFLHLKNLLNSPDFSKNSQKTKLKFYVVKVDLPTITVSIKNHVLFTSL